MPDGGGFLVAVELAQAYISLIPSMDGATGKIAAELGGVDTSKPGKTIGKGLSSSTAKNFSLAALGAKFQEVGGVVTDAGKTVSKKLTLPIVGAATAAGGLVAALGFKRLVGIDTARAQFKGLGYDADAVMAQVDKGVTNTSLSMAEGAAAATSILATGAVPLEGLEAQIKRVANVSAAYGVDASQANYLLNNVLTKQKVTWGDLAQMQQNNIPIVTALADEFGYTGEQIQEMAENGEISIDMLNQALDSKAGAAAEAYAESWEGTTKNILSNLGKIGAKMLEPTFEILKDKAAELLEFMKSPEFAETAASIGDAIADFVTKAIDFIGRLIDKWKALSPAQQKMIGIMAAVAVAAGPVITVIGKIISTVGVVIKVISGVATVLKVVMGAAKALFAVLAANPLGLIVTAIAAVVAGLVWFFTQTEIGKEIWQGFVDWLASAWEWLKTTAETVWTNITQFFVSTGENISTWWTDLWTGIGEFFSLMWENITSFFSGALEGILSLFMNWTLPGFIISNWDAIKTKTSEIWNSIVDFVKSIPERFLAGLQAIANLAGKMREWIGGVKDAAVEKFLALVDWVRGVPRRILDALGNLGSLLWNAGSQIISGLLDGIREKFEDVKNFVGGIGSWIADHKGPKAYDLALLVPAGGWIMQGLDSGLADGFRDVQRRVESFGPDLRASFSGSLSAPRLGLAGSPSASFAASNPGFPSELRVRSGRVELDGTSAFIDLVLAASGLGDADVDSKFGS